MADTFTIVLTAVGTLASAAVAGFISYIAGRSMKSHEWRLTIVREGIQARQRLYGEFLTEAGRLQLLSIENKVSEAAAFHDLFRRLAEIELLASDDVVEVAKQIAGTVMSSHRAGHTEAGQEPDYHSLKAKFISSAKNELKRLGC